MQSASSYHKANGIQLGDDFDNEEKKFHGTALAKLAASIFMIISMVIFVFACLLFEKFC